MALENLVNYAKTYAKHGFSVIPIGSDKKPILKFANKPPLTPEQIEEVWCKNPLANIALKTDKFFVIDIDMHGEDDGVKSVKELKHDEWFKDTLAEKTAHNGYHYYFQKPKNKKISQHIGILPGVDLKAHENNYILVSPSNLGGKKYKWLNHEPIKPAPKGLLNFIDEKAKEFKPYTGDTPTYNSNGGKSQTTELFEEIINGLGATGGRNNALASFIGGLLFRNVDPEIAFELGKLANANTEKSLSDNEVARTCDSMIEKEIKRREADDGG